MEMNWSRWFRCESSFGLLLVPNQPGVYALAEEIVPAEGPSSRRMLAVFDVDETDDLARSLSRLFALGSPWRQKLGEANCFVRYAVTADAATRHAAAKALKRWLDSQRDLAAQIFDTPTAAVPAVMPISQPEPATVAERAVDRVTRELAAGARR